MESKKEQEYRGTEEFVREKEKQEQEWQRSYKQQEQEVLEKIEQNLALGTQEARAELLTMFRNQEFTEIYKTRNALAYMIVIMQVYEKEIQAGEKETILDMGRSCQELKEKYVELKFILWRIDFVKDESGKEMLLDFIRKNHATPYMIRRVIDTSVFQTHQEQMLIKLSDIFIEQNMLRYAFHMLEYLDELSPGNEEILCMLAELMGSAGKQAQAAEYLDRVKKPGGLTERMRERYGC